MCFNKVVCLLLLAGSAGALSAQDTNTKLLDSFAAKLITNIRAGATERAYVSTDKSVYKAGEYVWFNAMLLNTASQKWSSKSKLLFADIVDKNDNIIKRIILDAANKQLYARIQLPDTLTTGYYWLRAYTTRMAAYDTTNIGIKPVYIVGKEDSYAENKTSAKENVSDTPFIVFYPEGGNMITGIDATVAVAASDKNGAPLSIEGIVKDNRDTLTTTFTTNANGLGKFTFEPSGFRHYKAIVNYNGKDWSYPLPPFDYRKGQIAVIRQPGSYGLRILLGDSIYKKNAITYVMGISKDSLVFAAFGKGLYQVNVDENKLPSGITTFYLFDTSFKLLSERSVYVNNNNVQVHIGTDKNTYNKGDKVNLAVSVTDASQHPVPALISVAVSDSVLVNNQPCHFAAIGDVHAADNLFLATHSCFSDEEKDLLMLTISNAYTAPDVALMQQTAAHAEDSLFNISGTVLNSKSDGANKVVTFISNSMNDGLFYMDTTDGAGRFHFELDSHPDSMQYALEVRDLNNRVLNNSIQTDNLAFPQLKTPAALKKTFATVPKPAISRLAKQYSPQWMDDGVSRLPPVTVKDQKPVDYDVSKRVSSSSAILSGRDLDGRASLDNVIMKVSGLQVINGYLVMRGLNSMKTPGAASEPLLLVDGVQVAISSNAGIGNVSPTLSYLSTLNPKDIDFIEVLKDGGSAANYGVRAANGVILINTINQSRDFFSKGNMKVFYAKGTTRPALFPINIHNEKDKRASPLPDARSTIFWNGSYVTGQSGNASFTFYTSDIPSTYTVTVTGVTQYGDLIYKTFNFKSR